jgi:pentatricopeptide repeat protein
VRGGQAHGRQAAHAALAYAGARDAAAMAGLVAGVRELAEQGRAVAKEVVLPLVLGIDAFAQGAYDEAIRQIEPVMPDLIRVGGSNAQREVFEDTLLQAYLRAGRFDAAEALLRRRVGRRHSARDFFWLGRARAEQGDPADARESFELAGRAWQGADPAAPEQIAFGSARLGVAGVPAR